ncbi:conserved hypothetical protein [Burkholderiales bacterium 8X]|nr:conserved hypothetical protein [Burkholderiales bacterium 8X]
MKATLCTLFEGHYHHGVAALVNSLSAAGYQGIVWVGHRGPLPSWITGHPGFDAGRSSLRVTPSLTLRAIALDPPVSLNYHKPSFMREVLEVHAPDADAIAYLDPDLVVKCGWHEVAARLAGDAIALVEDINCSLPPRHPKRLLWAEFFEARGECAARELGRYYNSGFVGVPRAQIGFLQHWQRICEIIAAHAGNALRQRKLGQPTHLFHSTDEDALNYALTLCDARLDTAGPEAMDFAPGGHYLSHAVGAAKPWQGRHLRQALRGHPPGVAIQWFYRFADGPLRTLPVAVLAKRRLSLWLAAAVGRAWRRA